MRTNIKRREETNGLEAKNLVQQDTVSGDALNELLNWQFWVKEKRVIRSD